MYGIYANIGGILMVNVTIYSIHGSYGIYNIGLSQHQIPTVGEIKLSSCSGGLDGGAVAVHRSDGGATGDSWGGRRSLHCTCR